jgi:hypothetical protein
MAEVTEHATLYAALAAAQSEMGKAKKETKNLHFKSTYADLASVMDACMGPLSRHGIAVFQPTFDEGGERFVKTILAHGPSAQTIECRVPLIVGKNDMQAYGSAVTYARRYGMACMCGVGAEDDDGNAAKANPPRDEPRPVQRDTQRHDRFAAEKVAIIPTINSVDELAAFWKSLDREIQSDPSVIAAKDKRKGEILDDEEFKRAAE